MRARWYDSATGRFTTRDPFPGFADVPQTLHPYVYALNNPINLTDPSGELPIETLFDIVVFGIDIGIYVWDALNPALDHCTRMFLLGIDLAALGADGLALVIPYLPGGGGLAGRLAGRGLLVFTQAGARASSGMRIIQIGVKTAQGSAYLARASGSGGGTRGVVGGGGQSPSGKTYRDRFYKKYPNAPTDYKIHHRIPRKARDMGIFSANVVDSVDNLRAVPENIHAQINTEWAQFWRRFNNSGPSPRQVEQFAKQIDNKYGKYFWQP